MTVRVGNAPVSFGVFEPEFGATSQVGFGRFLDMVAEAGYEGTELGPYGYLPTDPRVLHEELGRRNLRLGSSFVPIALADPGSLTPACRQVLEVGRLLATQGVGEVILADAGDAARRSSAGLEPPGWNARQWAQASLALETLSERLWAELGMRVVVHHHAGTYLETPAEIDRLLELTDPERVGLLLDTGHWVYGGGDPVDLLERHFDRVRYLHFKDVDAQVMERVRRERIDMHTAWRQDVFVPLGEGCVDFARIVELLRERSYDGWIIVEQDVVADEEGRFRLDPFACARASRDYLRSLGL